MSETAEALDQGAEPAGQRDVSEEAFEGRTERRESAAREDSKVRRALRQRAEARDEAQRERARAEALERELAELRRGAVTQRSEHLTAELDRAEAEHVQALAEGDPEKIAKATRRIATLSADSTAARLMAEQPPEPQREAARRPAAPQMAPEVADWCERNGTWFAPNADRAKNDEVTELALIASDEAIRVKKLKPGTAEYFRFIERRVENEFPGTVVRGDEEEEDEPVQPTRQQTQAPRAPAPRSGAAPVTRGGGAAPAGGQRRGNNLGNFTAAEVEQFREHAKVAGVPLEEYLARRKLREASGTLIVRRG